MSAILFVVIPSRILCSHSKDFRVLIWKNGSANVGEVTLFHAEVVQTKHGAAGNVGLTLDESRHEPDKKVKFEFSWKVSSHSWMKDRRTTDKCNSFHWGWTKAGKETIIVSVRILVHNGGRGRLSSSFRSYFVSNQTEVTVDETKASFNPYLAIKSFAGPKLPSDLPYVLPKDNLVEFEVKFQDPLKMVTNVSTDWRFCANSTYYTVPNWPNASMYHIFSEEGKYLLEVTVRATIRNNTKNSFLLVKHLHVKAPVSLKVQHKHLRHKDKTMRLEISCNGSLPVSFHWCISKQCELRHGKMCSPTVEHHSSCSLTVNHTFSDPGNYCVNVGVMNDVSGTNTSFMVRIPGNSPDPNNNSSSTEITITLVFALTLLISVIIIAVRKWVSVGRKTAAEKADFEFRGCDALSVQSGNTACSTRFKVNWSNQNKDETAPFCNGSRLYT